MIRRHIGNVTDNKTEELLRYFHICVNGPLYTLIWIGIIFHTPKCGELVSLLEVIQVRAHCYQLYKYYTNHNKLTLSLAHRTFYSIRLYIRQISL